MADNQDQNPATLQEHHNQDSTDKTTDVGNNTDMLRSTDLPVYSAAVQKVMNHNLNIAKDHAQQASPASASDTPIQSCNDSLSTTLQGPISFNVEWQGRVPGTTKAFTICPTVILPSHEATAAAATIACWRFYYDTKNEAVLTRFNRASLADHHEKFLGVQDVATFSYTDLQITSGGPTIKFEPYGADPSLQGRVKPTTSGMVLSADMFGSKKYSVELPINLGAGSVMWVFSHVDGYADGRMLNDGSKEKAMALAESRKKESGHTPAPIDITNEKRDWKVYPMQQLVDSDTGRILASYSRNLPGNQMAGKLTIFPKLLTVQPERHENLTIELIESIVITAAAMIDVQRRSGLIPGLLEAGKEFMRWLEEPPHSLHSDP